MPVLDHEVHEKVKSTATTPYGCSNQPRSAGYHGQLGWNEGRAMRVWIPDTMSKLCRYDKRPTDPRCGGCKLPSDEEYLRSYGL